MGKVEGRVYVHPVGSGKPSAQFTVVWADYPKSDRAKQAVEAVKRWARDKYRGCSVFVEAGTLSQQGDDGVGHLHVNGMEIASFSAVQPPSPVEARSLFGGGR